MICGIPAQPEWFRPGWICIKFNGSWDPIMTQRYAHHYPESLRDGVEALEGGRNV